MSTAQPLLPRTGSLAHVIVPVILATLAGGAILAASYFMTIQRDKSLPVEQRDLAALIRAVDFEEFWRGSVVRSDRETIEKRQAAGGAVHLTYHYKHEDGQSFELSSELHVMANRGDARELFHTQNGVRLVDLPAGFEPKETEAFQWGDASACGQFVRDDEICGFYFICRHHDRVFHVEISGSFAKREERFLETLLPHVNALDGYSP